MEQEIGFADRLQQLERGRFRSDSAMAQEGETIFLWQRYNMPFYLLLQAPPNYVSLLFPVTSGGKISVSGDQISNGDFLVMPRGSDVDVAICPNTGAESISIPHTEMAELSET